MNERQVVACGLLVACRDAAVMLDPVDEPLHEVAAFVPPFAEFPGVGAITARGDHGLSATFVNRLNQLVTVVALVRNHGLRFMLCQQFLSTDHVVFFAWTQAQLHRLTLSIYREMQLGAEATARAAEGFPARLFFSGEPAAC